MLSGALVVAALGVSWNVIRLLTDRHLVHSHLRIIGLIFLVPFLVWGGIIEYQFNSTQNQLTQALREVTDIETGTVNCQRLSESMVDISQHRGWVSSESPHRVELKRTVCQRLHTLMKTGEMTPETIAASHVFSHEAVHVLGEMSEPATECYAMQQDQAVWVILGGNLTGDNVGQLYYREYYPNMPTHYRSSDCSPGGALTLPGGVPFFEQQTPLSIPGLAQESDDDTTSP